jgi:hypothetical protein
MSCPYTSLQNGKAEHILHTINNMMHSMFFHTSILARYWVEGLHTVTNLLNCLPSMVISATSPYVASSYEHLCVLLAPAIPISPSKPLTNCHPGPLDVFSLRYSTDYKGYQSLISPTTTSPYHDTLFLMRQISPSLHHPV